MSELWDDAIQLRVYTEADIPALTALCQDADIRRWMNMPSPYTEADAREFIANVPGARAIVDARSGKLVGNVGFRVVDQENTQIAYWVARDHRGRGVATRALRLLSRWVLTEANSGRVQLLVEPDNEPSQRVAERAAFHREGLLRRYMRFRDGRRADGIMFSLLPEDL